MKVIHCSWVFAVLALLAGCQTYPEPEYETISEDQARMTLVGPVAQKLTVLGRRAKYPDDHQRIRRYGETLLIPSGAIVWEVIETSSAGFHDRNGQQAALAYYNGLVHRLNLDRLAVAGADIKRKSSSRGEYWYAVKGDAQESCFAFLMFAGTKDTILEGGGGAGGDEQLVGSRCSKSTSEDALASEMHEIIEGLRMKGKNEVKPRSPVQKTGQG
jgi:hypothetical protein